MFIDAYTYIDIRSAAASTEAANRKLEPQSRSQSRDVLEAWFSQYRDLLVPAPRKPRA